MASFFDQDSSQTGENRPTRGAQPTIAGHDEAGLGDETSDERPKYPDGEESISPGADPSESVSHPDAAEGVDGAGPGAEPVATRDLVAGQLAPDGVEPDTESTPSDAAEPAETQPAEPTPTDADADAEAEPAAEAVPEIEPIALPLSPPPTLAAPEPDAPASTAPPDLTPVGPPPVPPIPPAPPEPPAEPAPAPSSAGPAPSQLGSQPLSPIGSNGRVGGGVAGRFTQLWPAPVRAHPDQGMSSLVMLVALAVTVGAVGAGALIGLVYVIIAALGHG